MAAWAPARAGPAAPPPSWLGQSVSTEHLDGWQVRGTRPRPGEEVAIQIGWGDPDGKKQETGKKGGGQATAQSTRVGPAGPGQPERAQKRTSWRTYCQFQDSKKLSEPSQCGAGEKTDDQMDGKEQEVKKQAPTCTANPSSAEALKPLNGERKVLSTKALQQAERPLAWEQSPAPVTAQQSWSRRNAGLRVKVKNKKKTDSLHELGIPRDFLDRMWMAVTTNKILVKRTSSKLETSTESRRWGYKI